MNPQVIGSIGADTKIVAIRIAFRRDPGATPCVVSRFSAEVTQVLWRCPPPAAPDANDPAQPPSGD